MKDEVFTCCICGIELPGDGWGIGTNNPDEAAWKTEDGEVVFGNFKPEDRCCDLCNQKYVIPGRMLMLAKQRAAENN